MRELVDFMPFVQMLAATAEPLQIQEATREAIIRFMRDSQVFDDYVTIHTQECVLQYAIDIPECRNLVGIRGVEVNGSPFSVWQRDRHHDVIMFRSDLRNSCVEVNYTWCIGRDACEIPEKLYQDYMAPVQQAALAQLHTMFGSPVVSASRAADAEAKYLGLLADTEARKIYNFSNSRPKMHKQRRGGNKLGW